MLTEWTREMDVQPATNMNIATDNAHQVLLAQSYSAKRPKYLDGRVEHKAPNLPGKQSCACRPPTLKAWHAACLGGFKRPLWAGEVCGGVNAGLGCHNTGGIQRRGLQLLHRHIWPRLPERLCVLLQRRTLPATVGLLVWKWGMCVTGGLTTNTINFLH